MTPTRRQLMAGLVSAPVLAPRLARAGEPPHQLALTPSCGNDDDPTPAQTEGPYFKPASPEKQDFGPDSPGGERMTIAGWVFTTGCRPVARAQIELWHADENGVYDNAGFRLRGHQFSDAGGRWWFDTIMPGLYPGRTRHFHVKVQRPEGRVLTTQLYFPGEPGNATDRIFDAALLMDVSQDDGKRFGRYDLVVA